MGRAAAQAGEGQAGEAGMNWPEWLKPSPDFGYVMIASIATWSLVQIERRLSDLLEELRKR